ncbi:MAG TPA: hypothetical protein VFD54_16140, partial [Anaerolineales bacterium]|nr:hypothetical protein [Anaerolineales bacterium]
VLESLDTMQTILEIFYLRIVDKQVHFQRTQANLSKKGGDPNQMIQSLIQEKHKAASGKVEKKEFVVHSTSWRYMQPSKVVLTYVAYSDELEFENGKAKKVPLERLRKLTKKSRRPRSKIELEKQVVSHAMRHLAFLIKTDQQNEFKSALKPETKKVFKSLWVSLAGRVY